MPIPRTAFGGKQLGTDLHSKIDGAALTEEILSKHAKDELVELPGSPIGKLGA